jgi:hypothetical protein
MMNPIYVININVHMGPLPVDSDDSTAVGSDGVGGIAGWESLNDLQPLAGEPVEDAQNAVDLVGVFDEQDPGELAELDVRVIHDVEELFEAGVLNDQNPGELVGVRLIPDFEENFGVLDDQDPGELAELDVRVIQYVEELVEAGVLNDQNPRNLLLHACLHSCQLSIAALHARGKSCFRELQPHACQLEVAELHARDMPDYLELCLREGVYEEPEDSFYDNCACEELIEDTFYHKLDDTMWADDEACVAGVTDQRPSLTCTGMKSVPPPMTDDLIASHALMQKKINLVDIVIRMFDQWTGRFLNQTRPGAYHSQKPQRQQFVVTLSHRYGTL